MFTESQFLTELTWKKKIISSLCSVGIKDFGGSYKNKAHGKVDVLRCLHSGFKVIFFHAQIV